ncbi:acetyl-CoA carboxylase biotin carboxylase subunit family protein [Methanococcoides sp. NM1]|uniref:ATP-grasp domain-containing protein n=1 Tax=Methanococcoides sp. NM1 TaxID=1201013 RepID=UPI0010823149|nr:ATP-grasp domain-containing protein [Methanococcoides sp. NM1]
MKKNVFIVGMDSFNLEKLKKLPEATECNFHAALDINEIRNVPGYDMAALITTAERRIKETPGGIHAVVSYFDFPATDLVPILAKTFGVPGPSPESIFKCQHKYWSRLEQQQVIPDNIPEFCAFDPFEEDPLASIELEPPFWIKPFRSFKSFLAFRIKNRDQFHEHIKELRENINFIHEPFLYLLKRYNMPPKIANMRESCLVEKTLSGHQCTLEGYVFNGDVVIYGIVDSIKDQHFSSFSRYEYPSSLPNRVQDQMSRVCKQVIKHIGLDQSVFNVEFFYEPSCNEVYLLEINPRISQSHADLFEKVHGISHHRVMLQIALGRKPDQLEWQGQFNYAAKFMHRTFEPGKVVKAPSREEIESIAREIPGTIINPHVSEGKQLSELQMQDSYSYELADIFIGANERDELVDKYHRVLDKISFSIEKED